MPNITGKKSKTISEINVVPFIDIMLVLLVIFMITAPLMFNGIKLQLPKTKKVNHINLTKDQIVLSMSKSGDYFLGKEKVLFDEIIPEVSSMMKARKTKTVFLRADFGLRYGKVANLISHLKRGGISAVALVTEIKKMR